MTEQELTMENAVVKGILHKLVTGTSSKQVAYDAISKDDIDTLKVLIDAGLRFDYNDNYIFTALDNHADKCFDLLLESDASKCAQGKLYVDDRIRDVEPLEMACITRQQDKAEKLVEHGASLKTVLGRDILKYWKKYIADEDKTRLIAARKKYEETHHKMPEIDR